MEIHETAEEAELILDRLALGLILGGNARINGHGLDCFRPIPQVRVSLRLCHRCLPAFVATACDGRMRGPRWPASALHALVPLGLGSAGFIAANCISMMIQCQ
jgi:hypothetical protein